MTDGSRRLSVAAIVVLATLLVLTLLLWVFQRRLIYFPDTARPSTASLSADWSEVSYATTDGLTLSAWLRAPEPDRPIVIVLSGNAGNRGDRLALGEGLAADGTGVLLTDYRGYGGNPGHPSETGLSLDARAARGFVKDIFPDHRIVYFGESLGAAVAVELATEYPPSALVLRSPFTSLEAAARSHYPWLPAGLLLQDRYPSDERIRSLHSPLLVIAGTNDATVPTEQSTTLHAVATEPKHLLIIDGADHNDVELTSGPVVIDAVHRFLDEYLTP